MANIAQVAATYQSNFVSAFDVHKPDVMSKLFNRYGDQGSSWFMTLEKLGFVKPVASQTYYHYENVLKNPTFKNKTIISGGDGATLTVTLAAADVDTNNNFYPRRWDIVYFKSNQKGIIYSINTTTPSAPVLTIKAISTNGIPTDVAVGEEISIISNANSEGSDQPKGVLPSAIKRSNVTQIIKETLSATGSELTNQTWMNSWKEVPGSVDGAEQIAQGSSWYNLNWLDMEWRMGKNISGALLFGESGGLVTDPDTNIAIQTTEGLMTTAANEGNVDTYTNGAFGPTDFDAYGRTLDREYAGNDVITLASKSFSDEIENSMVAYLANTNIIYDIEQRLGDRFGTDGKSISIDFSYLKKSNRTYMFKRMMEFSNRQTFGISGSVTDGMGLMLPVGQFKDAKDGKMLDNIGARYKSLEGYSRKMEVWAVNGAGPGMKVTSVDVNKSFMRCEIGNHTVGPNQFILLNNQ